MKKSLLFAVLLSLGFLPLMAQKTDTTSLSAGPKKETPSKPGPKAFSEIITKKAISQKGVFTVHFQDDKYFFEIPDNLLG